MLCVVCSIKATGCSFFQTSNAKLYCASDCGFSNYRWTQYTVPGASYSRGIPPNSQSLSKCSNFSSSYVVFLSLGLLIAVVEIREALRWESSPWHYLSFFNLCTGIKCFPSLPDNTWGFCSYIVISWNKPLSFLFMYESKIWFVSFKNEEIEIFFEITLLSV